MAAEVASTPISLIESEKSAAAPTVSRSNTPIPLPTHSKPLAKVSVSSISSGSRRSSSSVSMSSAVRRSSSAEHSKEDSLSPCSKRTEPPKIVVKQEPRSPQPPSRHRPPKLHLSDDAETLGPQVPRTAGGNLSTLRDVGMACLSPGFTTHDPTMREQLQRSISVRDQQRSIIEARLQRHIKPVVGKDGTVEPVSASARSSSSAGLIQTPKRRPPNNLTIVPPPHQHFANERIVQSAPLNQSFTGRNYPMAKQNQLPQHTHNPHNVNRLPPIADVFASERLESGRRASRPVDPSRTSRNYYPPPRLSQTSPKSGSFSRPREHRSAEDALQILSGGREDLLPRIIHYGGHQPPTPPSPLQGSSQDLSSKSHESAQHQSAGRRRTRCEYERESCDFGTGSRDSPEMKRQKKEEFLSLCARAWELFHS